MKHLTRKAMSILTCSALGLTSSLPAIVSCAKSYTSDKVIFVNKIFNSSSRTVYIYFYVEVPDDTIVNATFASAPEQLIKIENPFIKITKNEGCVSIIVNDIVNYDAILRFSLILNFNGVIPTAKTDTLTIYYNYINDDDQIRVAQPCDTRTNDYNFHFTIEFKDKPLNDVIINLEDKSNLLSFTKWWNGQTLPTFTVTKACEKEGNIYVIDLDIYLKVSVFTRRYFSFNLNLSFINSKGQQQTQTLSDLCCAFDFNSYDYEVPKDLFNIDSFGVLNGYMDDVNDLVLRNFNTIRIPDNVTQVSSLNLAAEKMTTDRTLFTINNIIFPKTALQSFGGTTQLSNITCLDFSQADGPPQKNTTRNINLNGHKGTIIVPKNLSSEKMTEFTRWRNNQTFASCTADDWPIYSNDLVTPEDLYLTTKDETTDNLILTGVKSQYVDKLRDIAVIKLPDDVVEISDDALNMLALHPYSENGAVKPRQLILNPKLQIIGANAFNNVFISGPIVFGNDLKQIGEHAFFKATRHEAGAAGTISNITPIFVNCKNIKTLSSGAFELCIFHACWPNYLTTNDNKFLLPFNNIMDSAFASTFNTKSNVTWNFYKYPGWQGDGETYPLSLGESCFSSVSFSPTFNFSNVTISKLPSHCFESATLSSSFTLPNGLIEIGANCFSHASGITSVSFVNSAGDTFTDIGKEAYSHISTIKYIHFEQFDAIPPILSVQQLDLFLGCTGSATVYLKSSQETKKGDWENLLKNKLACTMTLTWNFDN